MATAIPFPGWQTGDANGTPESGGKIYFYVVGTTTPIITYSDTALTTPNANPVVMDASGWVAPIYISSETAYDYIVKSADEATTLKARTTVPSNVSGAQPVDATLTAVAGLVLADGDIIEGTGTDTVRAIKRWRDSYAELQAITTMQANDVCHVTYRTSVDDGGGGVFRWVTGDQSANVTADPGEGVWAAPDSDATGASGAWKRQYKGKLQGAWWGPAGDDTTDDTTATQRALNFAAADSGEIEWPDGIFKLTSAITVANPVTLIGQTPSATRTSTPNTPTTGTWFHLAHTGEGFYCRDDDAVGEGKLFTRFENFGTFRDHTAPGAAWTPTTHGADFRVEHRVKCEKLFLMNPYVGFYVRSSGCLWCDDIFGQPMSVGINIERSADVGYYSDVHWWPVWSQDSNVVEHNIDNAIGMTVRRCDGLRIDGFFHIYCHRLILAQDVDGDSSGMSGFDWKGLYADACGGGVEIHSDYYAATGVIHSLLSSSDASVRGTGPALHVDGAVVSNINVLDLACARSHEEVVLVEGAAHNVRVHPTRTGGWDRLNAGHYAFNAKDGAILTLTARPIFDATSDQYTTASSGTINLPVRATAASSGAQVVTEATTFTGVPLASGTAPYWGLYESDGPSDEKYWRVAASAGNFNIQARSDDGATAANPISITRTGTTVDIIVLAGTELRMSGDTTLTTKTPANASATGIAGTIAWDANYIYICTATNTWKRVAIATW